MRKKIKHYKKYTFEFLPDLLEIHKDTILNELKKPGR